MTPETKDLIITWYKRANTFDDEYVKFIIFYLCLDAWSATLPAKPSDTNKISWLATNINDSWLQDNSKYLIKLKTLSPIENMNPNLSRHPQRFLNDIHNKEEVVYFIYQIRCNLFHGTKCPGNGKNRNDRFVKYSYPILKSWVEKILENNPTI